MIMYFANVAANQELRQQQQQQSQDPATRYVVSSREAIGHMLWSRGPGRVHYWLGFNMGSVCCALIGSVLLFHRVTLTNGVLQR